VQPAAAKCRPEIVKGFEFEKGRYVVLLDEECDAIKPPSTRVIDLVQFAKATALDPIYINRSYYLVPDGPHAADPYAVIAEAIAGLVGIGKLAIYGREYLVAVRAQQEALVLHTLHQAAEIRPHEAREAPALAAAVVPFSQVKMARQVIAALSGPLNLAAFTDAYQADVRRLIAAKIAGEEIVVPPVETPSVLGFREALTVSLQAVRATTKKPATVKRAKAS
jgi:DNA end-binding protein Ku